MLIRLFKSKYKYTINLIILFTFAFLAFSYVFSNVSNKIPLNLISVNSIKYDFYKEFKYIINYYCKSDAKVLNITCLDKLSQLDHKISHVNKYKDRCLECLGEENAKSIIYHHTFWQIKELKSNEAEFYKRVIKLNIMSYLVTQNLCCTKLILWKLSSFPKIIEDELVKLFSYFIRNDIFEIKLFDFKSLCSVNSSAFLNTNACVNGEKVDTINHLISLSDFIRFVVLDVYGGIYTDGDVIYLKDMKLLWNLNFAYRWSYTENYNTAVLGINKSFEPSIKVLLDFIIKPTMGVDQLVSIFHPYTLTNSVKGFNNSKIFTFKPLPAFHSLLFDPPWTCFDGYASKLRDDLICGFHEFNDKHVINETSFSSKKFFGGAFTYHLHLVNCGFRIRNDSYFKYFENYYYKSLKKYLYT